MWTLQIIEHFSNESGAEEAVDTAIEHPGFLGGTYGEYPGSDGYYVQVFFSAPDPTLGDDPELARLPDGAKHVFVPPALQRWYGFVGAK